MKNIPEKNESITYNDEDFEAVAGKNDSICPALKLELKDGAGLPAPELITLKLERGQAIIGRSNSSGIRSDFEFDKAVRYVSKCHAKVMYESGFFFLEDMETMNGTYLNGERIPAREKVKINSGDEIGFSNNHRIVYKVC